MMFCKEEYDTLADLVFRGDFPGFKPEVKEMPNGDGLIDVKEYAHISLKNLTGWGTAIERNACLQALFEAHAWAEVIGELFGLPKALRPDIRYGALRVLRYPEGGLSHPHRDFDLFTMMLYRDKPAQFVAEDHLLPPEVAAIDPMCHIGELGEVCGIGKAMRHEVKPCARPQHSAVYFSIPDWDAKLPGFAAGEQMTVKSWLNERMARSRTAFKAYQ